MKLCKRTFKIETALEKCPSSKICKTLAAFPKVRGWKPCHLNHVNLGLVCSLGMCCREPNYAGPKCLFTRMNLPTPDVRLETDAMEGRHLFVVSLLENKREFGFLLPSLPMSSPWKN